MLKKYLFTLVVCLSFVVAKAQYFHDIGITAGSTFFKSDYGEQGDFRNFYANNGFTIGALYYLGMESGKTKHWKNYFRVRGELMYMQSELQHFGQWVDPAKTGQFATQLRGMRGSTSVANVGLQLEYYPLMTDDYRRGAKFSPYFALGFQLNGYSSRATSLLGELGNAVTTPVKYLDGFKNESSFVTSFSANVGTRYKLNAKSCLLFETRLLRFNSDWVDGLNPNRRIYTENKSNDYTLTISAGYIYKFD